MCWQNFAHTVDAMVNVSQGVQNGVLSVEKDNIGGTWHALEYEFEFSTVSNIVDSSEMKDKNALPRW